MNDWKIAVQMINSGKVAIIPTDTLYGIVAKASDKTAVRRIHQIKDRSGKKPFIILISNKDQLKSFGISDDYIEKTASYWPGSNSLIMPLDLSKYAYLTCGLNSLAFRLPNHKQLLHLIGQTGPLVAPSANPEGLAPALTITKAKRYFGDKIDFYLDGGKLENPPSNLIDLTSNEKLR